MVSGAGGVCKRDIRDLTEAMKTQNAFCFAWALSHAGVLLPKLTELYTYDLCNHSSSNRTSILKT